MQMNCQSLSDKRFFFELRPLKSKFRKTNKLITSLTLKSLVESSNCRNDFSSRTRLLDVVQWSRHRSFLYGCDRSPEMLFLN